MNEQLDTIIDFCFRGDVSWTIDQLEGTSYYNSAMAEIEENKKKAKAKLQRLIVEAELSELNALIPIDGLRRADSFDNSVFVVKVGGIHERIAQLEKELEK